MRYSWPFTHSSVGLCSTFHINHNGSTERIMFVDPRLIPKMHRWSPCGDPVSWQDVEIQLLTLSHSFSVSVSVCLSLCLCLSVCLSLFLQLEFQFSVSVCLSAFLQLEFQFSVSLRLVIWDLFYTPIQLRPVLPTACESDSPRFISPFFSPLLLPYCPL